MTEHLSASDDVDAVSASAVRALHGLLDGTGAPPGDGEPLPILWHWLAFLPTVPQADLGDDGHPRREDNAHLPRRMFAGARIMATTPLRVGEAITRHRHTVSVTDKQGRSGPLRFVEVRHELAGRAGPAVVEEQDLVYLPPTPPGGPAATPAGTRPEGEWPWSWQLEIDPVLLFRFSAVTYNAHRIHYDRDYATQVEGYPGLVVHGPLQAVALAELLRRRNPTRPVIEFSFRARRPAFDDGPLTLLGRPDETGDRVELAAVDHRGEVTMTAASRLGPP
jgi:3-methylfumaryl-CoA hydratase